VGISRLLKGTPKAVPDTDARVERSVAWPGQRAWPVTCKREPQAKLGRYAGKACFSRARLR
jgi:hypothetical protein